MLRPGVSTALVSLGLVGCAASLTISAAGAITTSRPPPPPPSATREPGPVPYEGAAWAEGFWEWDGLQFVWVDGYWVSAGASALRQASWAAADDRWTFVPGALIDPDGVSRPLPPAPRGSGGASGTVIAVPQPKRTSPYGSDADLDPIRSAR